MEGDTCEHSRFENGVDTIRRFAVDFCNPDKHYFLGFIID